MTGAPDPATAGEFVVTRTFDAPRELVFAAWTAPDVTQVDGLP